MKKGRRGYDVLHGSGAGRDRLERIGEEKTAQAGDREEEPETAQSESKEDGDVLSMLQGHTGEGAQDLSGMPGEGKGKDAARQEIFYIMR